MAGQIRDARAKTLRSAWNLLLVAAGLVFMAFGGGMVAVGFDTVSKVLGGGVAAIGIYVLVLGFRRGVVIDRSGITVRRGVRSSELIPWRDITSIDTGKTDCTLVMRYVPVVSLRGGEPSDLQPIAYYRFQSNRESRHVKQISKLFADYR